MILKGRATMWLVALQSALRLSKRLLLTHSMLLRRIFHHLDRLKVIQSLCIFA